MKEKSCCFHLANFCLCYYLNGGAVTPYTHKRRFLWTSVYIGIRFILVNNIKLRLRAYSVYVRNVIFRYPKLCTFRLISISLFMRHYLLKALMAEWIRASRSCSNCHVKESLMVMGSSLTWDVLFLFLK